MLEEQTPPARGLFIPAVLVGVVGLLLGVGIGFLIFQPRGEPSREELVENLSALQTQFQDREARLDQLQQEVARKEGRIEELVGDVGQVETARDAVEQEVEASLQDVEVLQGQIDEQGQRLKALQTVEEELAAQKKRVASLQKLVDLLEIDRLILVELRKDLPEERQEAVDYWRDIKVLAAQSDPTLGSKTGEVITATDGYFDWLEADFSTPEETTTMYYLLGADRYFDLIDEFLNATFLVVINRLDAVAELTATS